MITTLDFACFRLNEGVPEVLLRRRDKEDEPAYGEFTLIGGMVWEHPIEGSDIYDEDIQDAQKRIINMKIGIKPSFVEKVDTIGNAWRDSRGWSMTTLNICFFTGDSCDDLAEMDNMVWAPVHKIINGHQDGKTWVPGEGDSIKLPFDHNLLVTLAYDLMLHRFSYSTLIFKLLPEEVTVRDIIGAYSSFGIEISKTTIINRWIKTGILTDTGKKGETKKAGPKSQLFKYQSNEIEFHDVTLGRTKAGTGTQKQ